MANINEIQERDSGVASPEPSPEGQESPNSTMNPEEETSPEKKSPVKPDEESSEDKTISLITEVNDCDSDDEEDESLAERLIGLTEMLPSSLVDTTCTIVNKTLSFISASYTLSRQIAWVGVSTSLILFAPVMFEIERHNVEEMMKQDRNRLVLGPGSAMSGPPAMTPPAPR